MIICFSTALEAEIVAGFCQRILKQFEEAKIPYEKKETNDGIYVQTKVEPTEETKAIFEDALCVGEETAVIWEEIVEINRDEIVN